MPGRTMRRKSIPPKAAMRQSPSTIVPRPRLVPPSVVRDRPRNRTHRDNRVAARRTPIARPETTAAVSPSKASSVPAGVRTTRASATRRAVRRRRAFAARPPRTTRRTCATREETAPWTPTAGPMVIARLRCRAAGARSTSVTRQTTRASTTPTALPSMPVCRLVRLFHPAPTIPRCFAGLAPSSPAACRDVEIFSTNALASLRGSSRRVRELAEQLQRRRRGFER